MGTSRKGRAALRPGEKTVALRIPESIAAKIVARCEDLGVMRSDSIRDILENHFERAQA